MTGHRTLRKVFAFFARDLAIVRSYRMAFVLECWKLFLASRPFTISRDSFPVINSTALFRREATTLLSRWSGLPSSTISPCH